MLPRRTFYKLLSRKLKRKEKFHATAKKKRKIKTEIKADDNIHILQEVVPQSARHIFFIRLLIVLPQSTTDNDDEDDCVIIMAYYKLFFHIHRHNPPKTAECELRERERENMKKKKL